MEQMQTHLQQVQLKLIMRENGSSLCSTWNWDERRISASADGKIVEVRILYGS